MGTDDAYTELGLAPGATAAEVKLAWRQLVSKWHPDRNPSAAAGAKMQRLNQAYELLCAQTHHRGSPAPKAEPQAARGPRQQRRPEPPPPPPQEPAAPNAPLRTVSRKIKLPLEEAAKGCVKALRGKWTEPCPSCEGRGQRILAQACPACEGAGEVRQRVWYGFTGVPRPCEACEGDGRARETCMACHGKGKLPPQAWQLSVRIPHGVRDGDLLLVPGRPGRQGQARVALDLTIELIPHPFFRLSADGLVRLDLPVDGFAWMAQQRIEIPTLAGLRPLELKRDQLVYCMPGLGYPSSRRGAPGEMQVHIQPQFPPTFSAEQTQWLEQLVASHSGPTGSADGPLREWQHQFKDWQCQQGQDA